jgi:hypothetical protein
MYVTRDGHKLFVSTGTSICGTRGRRTGRNRFGLTFIESFWSGHTSMTPAGQRWPWERFLHYGVEGAGKDLFEDGYCDIAILLPTDLREFYVDGFNTTAQCAALKQAYPQRTILNGRMDPREGSAGSISSSGPRALEVQGRENLHRRVVRRVQGLFAARGLGRGLHGEVPGARYRGDPHPQRADDPSLEHGFL